MTTTKRRPPKTFSAIFQWRSLKTRVTLITLTFFLVGIWSLAFYSSYTLQKDMGKALGEQQFSTVTIIAANINAEMEVRLRALEKVAARITPAMMGNAATIQTVLEDRPALQDMFSAGTLICGRDGKAIADAPPTMGRIGINYADRDFMIEALKGKTTIGKPVMGKKLQVPVFVMATPIRDTKGKVIGVLAGVNNLGVPNFLSKITSPMC